MYIYILIQQWENVLAVPSAKIFLCEMIQLPQFLWILHTLSVNTYLYTHPNEKVRVYTGNDYVMPYHYRDNEYPSTIY